MWERSAPARAGAGLCPHGPTVLPADPQALAPALGQARVSGAGRPTTGPKSEPAPERFDPPACRSRARAFQPPLVARRVLVARWARAGAPTRRPEDVSLLRPQPFS